MVIDMRIIVTIVFVLLCILGYSQDDNLDEELYSKDTVFILLQKDIIGVNNGTRERREGVGYPEDISRRYEFGSDYLNTQHFYTPNDLKGAFYLVEDKKNFLLRSYITSDWFKDKSNEDILKLIQDKVLMVVDPGFALEDKYYLVRIFRYAGEE